MAATRVATRLRPFIPHITLAFVLAFAAPSNAQLTGLPIITSNNPVIGATTTGSSSSSSSSSSRSSESSTSSTTGATTTATDGPSTTAGGVSIGHLTALPTIYGVGVPPLIVPDTSNAAFMKKSDFPEGFVFICVGAILAILALSVITWRLLVAWSLQRSVKKAAAERYMPEKKSAFGGPTNYSSVYQSLNVSLEHLATGGDTYHSDNNPSQRNSKTLLNKSAKRASSNPLSSSLFFSPTAGGGQNKSARASTYLPSGYYASGTSALAGGAGTAYLGGPPAAGYGRVGEAFSDSPPITPGLGPQMTSGHDRSGSHEYLAPLDTTHREHQRKSSNLRTSTDNAANTPGTGRRAPSAMLDELFEHSTGMR